MYAGSKYAPTSNAGTAKAKQSFTAHATSSDDNNNYTPSALAPKFEAAGATLPPATDPRDRFRNTVASSLYDSDIFKPYVPDPTEEIESYLANTAVEDALKDALGIDDTARQIYQGIPTQEEPEPNIDMSVLQGALQPEPITVEELPDVITKAGDTLSSIAAENNLPVQDVIDANPQIKNPNMLRPGEVVSMPAAQAEMGLGRAAIMSAQQDIGQARASLIMKGIDKLFGLFPPKTDIEKKAKSELEYFLDAQPESSLPDFFKYVPDKAQLAEYMKGRAERKKSAGAMNFSDRSALTNMDNLQFVDIEDETGSAGLMTRPKARPEGLGAPIVRSYRDPVKVAVTTDKTASNIKDIQQALTDMGYKPNGVDGAMGGGTKRALRKFQAANNLPITGELTQEVADLLTNGKSAVYPDMPVPSAPVKDFDTNDFDVFSSAVADIESGNHGYTTYAYPTKVGNKLYKKGDLLYGGAGGHYLGRYQMGKSALADVGRKYTPTSNEEFLRDPALQDKLFKKYTMKNHKHLTINSEKYRNMTDQEKLGILGYAHNQGATAAEEYLFTGQVGADAFGTQGTKYTDAIAKALGN
jgi:peptidoglycan hydrolase-like protein with peptidoglycan-binding domain/LysM repeat protein